MDVRGGFGNSDALKQGVVWKSEILEDVPNKTIIRCHCNCIILVLKLAYSKSEAKKFEVPTKCMVV